MNIIINHNMTYTFNQKGIESKKNFEIKLKSMHFFMLA